MVTEKHIGKRVRFTGFRYGGMSAEGVMTRIDGTGMCRVFVTLDVGHERLGCHWAMAQSDLEPID